MVTSLKKAIDMQCFITVSNIKYARGSKGKLLLFYLLLFFNKKNRLKSPIILVIEDSEEFRSFIGLQLSKKVKIP